MASPADARAARTERLAGVGRDGQRRIADARVAVVGAGGLGSPVLLYLAAAGIGRLTVIDDDTVAASNLGRQIAHGEADAGAGKTASAARTIHAQNPAVDVVEHPVALDAANALDLLSGHDVIVDATDRPESRYLVSDAAALLGIPEVWGAALAFDGAVSVFGDGPGGAVDYRDLHPDPAVADGDTCETVGVLGPVCGVIGSAMAVEALKLVTGTGAPLFGRVQIYDARTGEWRGVPLRRRADRVPVATVGAGLTADRAPEIEWDARGDRALVDVRDPSEHAEHPLPGARLLPLAELLEHPEVVGTDPVLVVCARGARSARAVTALRARGVDAVSLRGGMAALPASAIL